MLLAIGIVAWAVCGVVVAQPRIEEPDSIWVAAVVGVVFVVLGPLGLLVEEE
jgi:CDP-diglyceride synthetase